MNDIVKLTPEIAMAMASYFLSRENQVSLTSGSTEGFIFCESNIVISLKELCDVNDFRAVFLNAFAQMKHELMNALRESDYGQSHGLAGFQFVSFPCDEFGKRAIDLTTNQFITPYGIALAGRLFARKK